MCNDQRGHGRAFSLVETMVASAILGLIGAGVLTTMSFASTEAANSRVRTLASADAQAQLDRMVIMSGVANTDALRCALFQAAGGPMDATTGGVVSGACPTTTGATLVVTGIPIPASTLERTVSLEAADLGDKPGLLVTIKVAGEQLPTPVIIRTQMKR